jgi:hypothetical protein
MIYASQKRAEEIAEMLNRRAGCCPSAAVLSADGWSVVCGWDQATIDKWDLRKQGEAAIKELTRLAENCGDQLQILYNTPCRSKNANDETVATIVALEARIIHYQTVALMLSTGFTSVISLNTAKGGRS